MRCFAQYFSPLWNVIRHLYRGLLALIPTILRKCVELRRDLRDRVRDVIH
jgi:hypothetical protein